MILIAPVAGRWYDRAGGRAPLILGFVLLALSGVVLALGASANAYLGVLPGLLLFGVGLAFILTVNDPVTLDMVPAPDQGQASGVSATAEQFGGAVGIAALYVAFHVSYLNRLSSSIAHSALPNLTAGQALRFKNELFAAEQTGLRPRLFDPHLVHYLRLARSASNHGYAVAFLAVSVLAALAIVLMAQWVRKTTPPTTSTASQDAVLTRSWTCVREAYGVSAA